MHDKLLITLAKGTLALAPSRNSTNTGLMKIPMKLPNAELKIAAASFPPTAFVSITAEETGGGMHERTVKPFRRWAEMSVR